MKLCAKEIQEPTEERMGRQRKTSLDVGEEEDPLPFARLWLGLSLRQSPRLVGYQPVNDEILDVLRRDGRPKEISLDLPRRRRRSGARRLLLLDSLLGALELLRLPLRHRGGGRRDGAERRAWSREGRRKRGEWRSTVPALAPSHFITVRVSRSPVGPLDPCVSRF